MANDRDTMTKMMKTMGVELTSEELD